MSFHLYAWSAPRDLDADGAAALVASWEQAGGDPATRLFEPTTDVGWFHRELTKDAPGLDASSDAVPNPSTRPVWLSGENEPKAMGVAIQVARAARPKGGGGAAPFPGGRARRRARRDLLPPHEVRPRPVRRPQPSRPPAA